MLYIVKVWDEGELYEYEYGCIEHALEHMKVEKGCAKLYRYHAGVETLVESVAETVVYADTCNDRNKAEKPPQTCKRNR